MGALRGGRRPQEGAAGAARHGAVRALLQKMSAGRWLPARWWWWLPALLWSGAGGYVVVSSVSWPLPEEGAAADELHSSSTEEALPALLEEAGGLWKQSYPASAYREDAALGSGPAGRQPGQGAAPSRMFSYRREGGGSPGRVGTARFLARYNTWGFVATRAAQGKVQCAPVPTPAGRRGHALPGLPRLPGVVPESGVSVLLRRQQRQCLQPPSARRK